MYKLFVSQSKIDSHKLNSKFHSYMPDIFVLIVLALANPKREKIYIYRYPKQAADGILHTSVCLALSIHPHSGLGIRSSATNPKYTLYTQLCGW